MAAISATKPGGKHRAGRAPVFPTRSKINVCDFKSGRSESNRRRLLSEIPKISAAEFIVSAGDSSIMRTLYPNSAQAVFLPRFRAMIRRRFGYNETDTGNRVP
jgi:hypothetical protein